MAEDSLLRMIERIYEASTEPETLAGLASELSQQFSANMGLLYIVQNPKAKSSDLLLSATASFDDEVHSTYTNYYRQCDIWGAPLLGKSGPAAFHGLEVADPATLARSEVYNDWYSKVGIVHVIAGLFPVRGDIGVVSVSRARRAREFDDDDKRRLDALVPHFQRAIQIQQRLSIAEQQRSLTLDVLEGLAVGIIIVEADTRIAFANSVARNTLRAGNALTSDHGCLRLRHPANSGKFEKLIQNAAMTSLGRGTHAGGVIAARVPKKAPLPLLVSPYKAPPAHDGHTRGAALIMFAEPSPEIQISENMIAQLLDLSPAEARLLSALVAGQTMAEYAERVGISINTAKTQMRQIYLKTGYNRQSDVIRAVVSNPVVKLAK